MATSQYYVKSWSAIATGAAAATAALAYLLRDVDASSWEAVRQSMTVEMATRPVLVLIAVTAAHSFVEALRDWRAAALLYGAIAAVTSGYIVYESMGQRAERKAGRAAVAHSIQADNASIESLQKTLAYSIPDMRRECTRKDGTINEHPDPKVWPECHRKLNSVHGHQERIKQLQSRTDGKIAEPVEAQSKGIAAIVSVAGGDGDKVRRIFDALDPFWAPVIFEVAAIVFLTGGWGRRLPALEPAPAPSALEGPEPVRLIEHDPIIMALTALGGRTDSSDALVDWLIAHRGQGSKADVSRKLKELHTAGIVRHYRDPNDARRKITELVDMAQ